ncbi:histone-fold-containing protein [Periconia macrospinosa]|uniref:Histone-fold-containing protein n=1 Tax=Periconia macrospinosa TaxID=97972 RepID=A0A2V1DXU7_9PLEO|nr:histone-fold-containing protein [Periconia macrospinosa]
MPYNNTPIAPPKDISGQVSLPLARVQKIINADPERLHTSKNAAFAIALATEMFIQHLATTTHNVVKAERKPRRNIQYRDVSSAVAKTDNLEFLTDVVPKTITMKEYKKREEAKKKAKDLADKEKAKAQAQVKEGQAATTASEGKLKNGDVREAFKAKTNGHTKESEETLSEASAAGKEDTEAMEVDQEEEEPPQGDVSRTQVEDSEPEEDGAAMQIEMEMRGPRNNSSPVAPRRSSGFTAVNNGS